MNNQENLSLLQNIYRTHKRSYAVASTTGVSTKSDIAVIPDMTLTKQCYFVRPRLLDCSYTSIIALSIRDD